MHSADAWACSRGGLPQSPGAAAGWPAPHRRVVGLRRSLQGQGGHHSGGLLHRTRQGRRWARSSRPFSSFWAGTPLLVLGTRRGDISFLSLFRERKQVLHSRDENTNFWREGVDTHTPRTTCVRRRGRLPPDTAELPTSMHEALGGTMWCARKAALEGLRIRWRGPRPHCGAAPRCLAQGEQGEQGTLSHSATAMAM